MDDDRFELAIAVNAAFKGLLASMGQSGHICARTIPVQGRLDLSVGWPGVMAKIAADVGAVARDGDVVVVADKIVGVSQGRLGPIEITTDPDPKTISPAELPQLALDVERKLGFRVTPLHLLIADQYSATQACLGADDHNAAAADLARTVRERTGLVVDVIVSDTDTGLDVRSPLIGTITIGATPLGATAGVNLYEAMRCAVAAEFVRGHDLLIPVVICVPAERRRGRTAIGEPRPYGGALHVTQERGIAHA